MIPLYWLATCTAVFSKGREQPPVRPIDAVPEPCCHQGTYEYDRGQERPLCKHLVTLPAS